MGILIGMDEAGYGPHFGPLVVAATAWEVPEEGSEFGVQGTEAGEFAMANGGNGQSAAMLAARPVSKRTHRRAGSRPSTPEKGSECVDLYRLLRNIVAKSVSDRRI